MSIKQKVEEHAVIFFLGTLLVGFISGVTAYKAIVELSGQRIVSIGEVKAIEKVGELKIKDEQISTLTKRLDESDAASRSQRAACLAGQSELLTCQENAKKAATAADSQIVQCESELKTTRVELEQSAAKRCDNGAAQQPNVPATQRVVEEASAKKIDWSTDATKLCSRIGQRFTFSCPPEGSIGYVYGDGEYTCGSPICSAAVHAGRINARDGGTVVVRMLGITGNAIKGILRYGIKSNDGNDNNPAYLVE